MYNICWKCRGDIQEYTMLLTESRPTTKDSIYQEQDESVEIRNQQWEKKRYLSY